MGTGNGGVHKVSSQRQERGQDLQGSEVWPNFFIVGAAKAGTSSLYAYLRQHPQVYMSAVKEPHFFSQIEPSDGQHYRMRTTTDRESYLKLFRKANGALAVGEASPSYLWDERAPHRIREQVPEARIIMVLRDPIERAHSHYLMNVRENTQPLPFYEALREDQSKPNKSWTTANLYVELGQYASQVERYLGLFGPERLLVLMFEDLKRDPATLVRRTARFLGVDEGPVADMELGIGNPYNAYALPRGGLARGLYRSLWMRNLARYTVPQWLRWKLRDQVLMRPAEKPAMDARALEALRGVYAGDVEKLEGLLGRPLPELRRSWKVEVT
jgi:Sulfotransferase domain